MVLKKFTKKALSPQQILQKLQNSGFQLGATPPNVVENYIEYIGGYRLKGYWHQSLDPITKAFIPGKDDFSYLSKQVQFDEELRLILWQALNKVELAVRASIANHLSIKHSPHWFLNHTLFIPSNGWGFGNVVRKIEEEVGRSRERKSVEHYFSSYSEPHLPPSWLMSECVTLGFWSRTYQILSSPDDKIAISKRFDVSQPAVFESWLHAITYLRNVIAHHGQLMGTTMRIAPQHYKGNKNTMPKGQAHLKISLNLGPNNRTFHAIAKVLHFLIFRTGLPTTLKADLVALVAKYPSDFGVKVGFFKGWDQQLGW